jgi:hypothetical protein
MTCPDCATASQVEHWGCTASCKGCAARSLARIFLAKGEHGRRYRLALQQFGLTDAEVREANAADAARKEPAR